MSLIKYIFRRILIMVPILFGVLTLTFILSRLMPGDPIIARIRALGINRISFEEYQHMKCQLGLCDPMAVQYFRFISELFTGDWGVSVSITRNEPVWDLVIKKMPLTIDLTIFTMVISIFFGLKTGIISATHRNETTDTVTRGIALIGVSLPVFFLGMLLQYFLGVQLGWFDPTGHLSSSVEDPSFITGFIIIDALMSGQWYLVGDYLWHLFLPVFCLSFIMLASITRQTRSSVLEVMQQDYIRTARAKGCEEKDILRVHTLRNALIPTITIIGIRFSGLLGGSMITESVFGLSGIGKLFVDAILLYDYWVINAIIFVETIIIILVNLLIDIIYAILDPRIRFK